MNNSITSSFLKFTLGFVGILAVSFLMIIAVGYYDRTKELTSNPAASQPR